MGLFGLLLFFKRILRLILWGVKPVFVFEGKTPDIKRKTVMERFHQRYNASKNYKKIAQRMVMDVLENKKKKGRDAKGRNSGDSAADSQSSAFGLPSLDKEQEDEILKMVDELEQALEFKEFEEVC